MSLIAKLLTERNPIQNRRELCRDIWSDFKGIAGLYFGNKILEAKTAAAQPADFSQTSQIDLIQRVADLYLREGDKLDVNKQESAIQYLNLFKTSLDEINRYNILALNPNLKKILSSAYDMYGLALIKQNANPSHEILNKAKQMYNISKELNPNNVKPMLNLAAIYFFIEKDYRSALSLYEEILRIEPNNSLGKLYKQKCLKAL